MLADCEGLVAFARDASYAGVELALIQRGARTLGAAPSNGVSEAQVAGKKIQLALACGDGTGQKALSEARRLVDQLGADVVIGPAMDGEALALTEYANLLPATTFIEGVPFAQSLSTSASAATSIPTGRCRARPIRRVGVALRRHGLARVSAA